MVDRTKWFDKGYYEDGNIKTNTENSFERNFELAKNHILNLKNLLANKKYRILEIGCAYGHVQNELMNNGYINSYGVDISEYAINKGKEKLIKIKDKIFVKNIEDDDFAEFIKEKTGHDNFDFIISWCCLEHILDNKVKTVIKNMHLILDKDGFMLHMIDSFKGDDITHYSIHDKKWWIDKFSDNGFLYIQPPINNINIYGFVKEDLRTKSIMAYIGAFFEVKNNG